MPIATNPKSGEVVFLDSDGSWKPAQTSVNPETSEMLAFDGSAWTQVPASKGAFQYIDDAVRSIASGVTFGWADEFAAKMDELIGRGDYASNLTKEQARDAQIPVEIKLPGEIAGAVGSSAVLVPVGALRALAATSSRLSRAARFGTLGAAEGAVAGAGTSQPGERTEGAAAGAVTGAAIGAVAPSAVEAVVGTGRAVRNALRPKVGAEADLARAVMRDQMTASGFADRLTSAEAQRPGQTTLADVGGENVRGLVERVAQTPGAGRTIAIPALTARQQGQLSRISDDLRGLTGTGRTAVQAVEEAVTERASAATPLYEAAYDAGDRAIWSPVMERLSSSPTVRDAMSGAVRVWRDNAVADGFGAVNPGALVDRGGQLSFLNGKVPVFPNLQFWDYTKRIIDDQIGEAVRSGKDQKARTLTRLVQVLRGELDSAVGEYRAARDAWAGPSSFMNAIEEGRNVASRSVSAEEMAAQFRALSPSEQEGYRIGAVSKIIATMGNDTARLPDLTKYLRSPEMRAKIAAMMPTPQAAESWLNRLGTEVKSSELVAQSLGNSATARRLAEMEDAKGIVGDLVMESMLSGPTSTSLLRRVFTAGPKWLRDTLRSRTDKELADLLLNPERAGDLPAVLRRIRQQQGSVSVNPAIAGGVTAGGAVAAQ